jgi:glycosyltransferase involved in cell wall biosynthesis
MHIVFVGDYPQESNKVRGGVEAVVLYLTQALQVYPDLHLDVVTLERQGRGEHQEQHGRVTVHYLPVSPLPSRFSPADNVRRMGDRIRQLQPNLVHAHIAGEYALAAAASGRPWLLTLHGIRHLEAHLRPGLLNRYRGWFVQREEFQIVRRAPSLISINPFVQAVFTRQIRGKVYAVENPIADAFFDLAAQRKPYQLLYAGRLIPRKDILTLLRAFARLHQQLPVATLRLAGGNLATRDGSDYYGRIQAFVAEAGLQASVTFLGELDEAALLAEYAACAALVLTSTLETAPMGIMQAMAAGKPVFSTDVGGVRYLVDHGRTGYLVPIGDSEGLAQLLYRTLRHENQLERMGQCARALAEQRFRAGVVAAQTRTVYAELV